MTWMPALPTRTSRRPLRRKGTGDYFQLNLSVLGAGVTCTDLINDEVTSPGFLTEGLTSPRFIDEALTSPTFLNEEVC